MNMDYSGLWQELARRGLKKTDLIELCGISSRTLSKLSKNQNVNTDTLLAVCRALDCELSDIAAVRKDGEFASLYDAFRSVKCETFGEGLTFRTFDYKGQRVAVLKTVDKANKRTVIKCEGNSVVWEQSYPLGHCPVTERRVLLNTSAFADEKDAIKIVVISSSPSCIQGLDEGDFLSHLRFSQDRDKIFVMSEPRFKIFSI